MKILKWTGFVLAALVVGVLAAKPLVIHTIDRAALHNGPWRVIVNTGSASANIYERAAIAVAGLYALSKEETLYYTAYTDGDGQKLDAHCDYQVTGQNLPTRWWSLTMYGDDNYLVPNAAGIYSRHAGNLESDADSHYTMAVSAQAQPHNWLPSPATGPFSITLRLYNPQAAVYEHLTTIALPQITRGACR